MRKYVSIIAILIAILFASCHSSPYSYSDGYIQYQQAKLPDEDKQKVLQFIDEEKVKYNPAENLIMREITAWNYHTDTVGVTYHDILQSLNYANALLDTGSEENVETALRIIDKAISLQDTDPGSPSCGVWPYFKEEPLKTKKTAIDYNWADFNAVALLDAYLYHNNQLSEALKGKVENALELASRSIEKRNVGPEYTNIAIMGTYVTYMTAHLLNLKDLQVYARNRLNRFFDYTIEKGGFTEYNSPTYTIIALDELKRMQNHIIEPEAKWRIDSLYNMNWEVFGRHYHKPSGQWAGPHSRSYSSLLRDNVKELLYEASNHKIDLGKRVEKCANAKIKHSIPQHLVHYFTTPTYPRQEVDTFECVEPQVIGTTYMTELYALSTSSRSTMWNQRRPFLLYFGNIATPHYIQLRLLHDEYDFCSGMFYSRQKENDVLSSLYFLNNAGDKHINLDKLTDGKFKMKDLRLRFEVSNFTDIERWTIPANPNDFIKIQVGNVNCALHLFFYKFGNYKGYWEKGSDGTNSWMDYVIYSGPEKTVDLLSLKEAIMSFTFSVNPSGERMLPSYKIENNILYSEWEDMKVSAPIIPQEQPQNI